MPTYQCAGCQIQIEPGAHDTSKCANDWRGRDWTFSRGSDGKCTKCDKAEGDHHGISKFCYLRDWYRWLGLTFSRGSDGQCTKCGNAEGDHHGSSKYCYLRWCCNCYICDDAQDGSYGRQKFVSDACPGCKGRRDTWGGVTTLGRHLLDRWVDGDETINVLDLRAHGSARVEDADALAIKIAGKLGQQSLTKSLTALHLPKGKLTSNGAVALGEALRKWPPPAAALELTGIELSRWWKELGLPEGASGWKNEEVFEYWRQLQKGASFVPRAKCMFVGAGNVGKSTLRHRLQTGKYMSELGMTDGVDVRSWELTAPDGTVVILVTWDCGGQPIYMATHPLFFTADCIYLGIWNPRSLTRPLDEELREYVDAVRGRSGKDAKIIFISTHADSAVKSDIKYALQKLGEAEAMHFHISSKTGEGVDELKAHIAKLAAELARKQSQLPDSYLKFEKELQTAAKDASCGVLLVSASSKQGAHSGLPCIHELARRCGLEGDAAVKPALRVLMQRGSVLYYETAELEHLVFADPQQLADLMATTITCESSKSDQICRGVLSPENIDNLWASYPSEVRHNLLHLLHELEVAYPLPDGAGSLVPAMLPEQVPAQASSWLDLGVCKANIEIKLSLLPPDFLHRLLVRTSSFALSEGSWKSGVLLQRDGGKERAVISLDRPRRTLSVTCSGEFAVGLRGLVFQTIERLLSQWFKTVTYNTQISCPKCNLWACSSKKISLVLKMNRHHTECTNCFEMVPVADLAAGVVPLSEAELTLARELASEECRPERLMLMRRDVRRVLESRLGDTVARRPLPLLWAAIRQQDGAIALQGVCEHPEGWHVLAGMQTSSPEGHASWEHFFLESEYWKLIRPAALKLMGGDLADAELSGQEGGPLCGEGLADFLKLLSKGVCGDGERLQPVRSKEGTPLWLCPAHAAIHSTSNGDQYVQWKFLKDNGEFESYNVDSSRIIEQAYQAGQHEVELKRDQFKYRIFNLQATTQPAEPFSTGAQQQNITHKNQTVRKIVRREFSTRTDVPLPLDAPLRMAAEFQLVQVERHSAQWQRVYNRIKESLPMYDVTKVERVVNKYLWERYVLQTYQVARNNSGDPNERELFHYSKDFEVLLKGQKGAGFDPRMKRAGGNEYGNGVYFAQHAAYCVAYAQGWLFGGDPPAAEVKLLLALVALGDCKDFGPLCSSERGDAFAEQQGVQGRLQDFWPTQRPRGPNPRNRPPPKDMKDKNSPLYDSVCGTEGNLAWSSNEMMKKDGARLGQQYVVFETAQAYPSVLITLRLQKPDQVEADLLRMGFTHQQVDETRRRDGGANLGVEELVDLIVKNNQHGAATAVHEQNVTQNDGP